MAESPSFVGRVPVPVALALLVSLRDVDTPTDPESFGESELPLNLRRRLGLSSVVVDQIRRYERRKGGAVSADEVASLFELISRRSDARSIFEEAGRRIADEDMAGRRFPARIALRALPAALRRRSAWRRVRRLAKSISPHSVIRVERKPSALIIEGSLPARAAEGGVGCEVLSGMIRQVFLAYHAGEVHVLHPRCEARAEAPCSWELNGHRESAESPAAGADELEPEIVQAVPEVTTSEEPVPTTTPHSESVAGS